MRKYPYRERREIDSEDLRNLCIKNHWYTLGSCSDYENLFSKILKSKISTDDIIDLAFDILEHSNTDETVTNIAYKIGQICIVFFEEK